MKKIFIALLIFIFYSVADAQMQIYPPHWWTGMQDSTVQLMVHRENIAATTPTVDHPGVRLDSVIRTENPNYLFLNLTISENARPGIMTLRFALRGRPEVAYYELKQRAERSLAYGLDGNDFIYLIMPDRFVNGDPSNDIVPGTQETTIDRSVINARHGGDLQGIIGKLDYLQDLGVTATWLTPPQENDQPKYSYHGYAMTDHYTIDPRIGDLSLYRQYVQESHARGMQVVFDVVHNHIGNEHWLYTDAPSANWYNQWDSFTRTNYRTSSLMDMYASEEDRRLMTDGWFDTHMPDLNQRNPLVAKYLTQWTIWWIEEMQVDAIRLDTYSYADQTFLSQWALDVLQEYPGFTLFAEVWVNGLGVQGYYNGNNNLNRNVNTHLSGVLDFEMNWTLGKLVNEDPGWNSGNGALYLYLCQDYLFGENGGADNVIFLDNHDMSRFYEVTGKDLDKMKMATGILLTTRGIPQWFYGSEILMDEPADPMDRVREDFPGGWPGDTLNKFTAADRSPEENTFFQYLRTLARWHAQEPALKNGKLMQFVPDNGIYVYFRFTDDASVMVIVNGNAEEQELDTARFRERLHGYTSAVNIESGALLKSLEVLQLPAMSTTILKLHP